MPPMTPVRPEPTGPNLTGLNLIEEAGHAFEAAIAGNDAEIGSLRHGRTAFGCQSPGEADPVVMAFRVSGQGEAVAGKALMDGRDQAIDAIVTLALHEGIDVARSLVPGAGDQRA